MSNFLERLEIEMEKKHFSFLLIFFITFLAVDIVSIIIIQIQFTIIYLYLIPLIIVLIFAGLIIDKRRRAIFLLLLIPEGFLTLILAFVTDPFSIGILWVFIGVFSGFTIIALLGYFADITNIKHRGKVAGFITGIAWIVAAVLLSWLTSDIILSTVNILMFVFGIIKIVGGILSIYLLFKKSESSEETIISSSKGQGFMETLEKSYNFIWGNSTFRIYLISFIMIWFAQGLFLPFGGLHQESPQNYQAMASIGFAAGGLFLIVGGFMLDKGRKQMAFIGAILATISFTSYYFPIGAVFLAAIPILLTTIIIILGDVAPADTRGRFYSNFLLFNFLAFFAGFLTGFIIGGSANVTMGDYPGVVITCVIITAIALLLIYIWGKESNLEEVSFTEQSISTSTFTSEFTSTDITPPKNTFEPSSPFEDTP